MSRVCALAQYYHPLPSIHPWLRRRFLSFSLTCLLVILKLCASLALFANDGLLLPGISFSNTRFLSVVRTIGTLFEVVDMDDALSSLRDSLSPRTPLSPVPSLH